MSRANLIKKLKKKNPELHHTEIEKIITIFCESIKNAVKNNQKVEIRGFGSFFIKKIKEKHSARNPKTGELIYIPEKNKIRFKASKNFNKEFNE